MTGPEGTVFPWRRQTLSHELVVVDVEGNGGQPPEIVEIALLPITSGRPVAPQDVRSWLVRPTRPITGLVTRKVHGITNADVVDAPRWSEIAADVAAVLDGRVLVAHHAHVERGVLGEHLPGWTPEAVLDTARLAKHLWPGLAGGYGLDNLIAHADLTAPSQPLGTPDERGAPVGSPQRRHRAGFDTWMTAALLHALLAEHHAQQQNPESSRHRDPDAARLVAAAQLPERRAESTRTDDPREGLW